MRVIFLLLAIPVVSCSGGDSSPAAPDAGSDASSGGTGGSSGTAGSGGSGATGGTGGVAGAAGTAGSSGAAGGGATAGQGGAGGIAWWDENVTQWKQVPWAPQGCDVRYAIDPVAAAPALDWKPCVGGPPGCEMLDPSWPSDATYSSVLASVGTGPVGYRVAVGYYVIRSDGVLQKHYVLYDAAGAAVATLHSTGACTLNGRYVAGDQTCIAIADLRNVTSGSGTSYFACGTDTTPVTLSQPTASIGVDLPQGTFSGELLALDSLSPKAAEVLDIPAKQFHLLVSPVQGGDLYDPFAVGTDVVVRATTAPGHEVAELWKRPDTTATLVDPAGGRTVADVRADAHSLVWIEADTPYDAQGIYPHGYLYAAPFVETAAALQPKLIRDLPTNVSAYMPATAGGGYYLIHRVVESLDLFRISDGHHWLVTAPAGLAPVVTPIAVDSTYAFYGANKPGLSEAKVIVRQRLDALGPGD